MSVPISPCGFLHQAALLQRHSSPSTQHLSAFLKASRSTRTDLYEMPSRYCFLVVVCSPSKSLLLSPASAWLYLLNRLLPHAFESFRVIVAEQPLDSINNNLWTPSARPPIVPKRPLQIMLFKNAKNPRSLIVKFR